jgi:hypothetical protein
MFHALRRFDLGAQDLAAQNPNLGLAAANWVAVTAGNATVVNLVLTVVPAELSLLGQE